MKRCSECERTYADDTITFCLADGSLLSAPYDLQAHQRVNASRIAYPPRTAMYPAPNPASMPLTQQAKEAAPVMPTMVVPTPPSIPIGNVLESPQSTDHDDARKKTPAAYPRWYIMILFALSLVLVFVIGFAVLAAAYVQDVTPLIAGTAVSLVIVIVMVACVLVYRKRKRDA